MAVELVERLMQILFNDLRQYEHKTLGSLRIGMDEVHAILALEARIQSDAAEIARLRAELAEARGEVIEEAATELERLDGFGEWRDAAQAIRDLARR